MKTLVNYIQERLVINKDYKIPYTCAPKSFEELRKIIKDRYNKLGAGTKQKPINFNDVDVSNINSFFDDDNGILMFEGTKFEYIDISDWNVSNVENMGAMFQGCEQLKSIGDISNWNVSNVEDMGYMFFGCEQLKSVGDISDWDVSKVKRTNFMFYSCRQLKSVGDLSNWTLPKVKIISRMFYGCTQLKSVGDLSNWDVYVSNIKDKFDVFDNSGITNIPKWYKK